MTAVATQTDETATLAHRVVRVVAFVAMANAILTLLQYVIHLFVAGSWWADPGGSFRLVDRAIQLSLLGVTVLLLAGGIGMLRRKPWSRPAVMLWAVLLVLINFATNLMWMFKYAQDLSTVPSTMPAFNPPLWKMALHQMFWWAESTLLPLLVWLILRQPQVAKLFEPTTAGGGFEVVPFAQAVHAPASPTAAGRDNSGEVKVPV